MKQLFKSLMPIKALTFGHLLVIVVLMAGTSHADSVTYSVTKQPQGHSEFKKAEQYFNAKDFKRSVDFYERAAKKGYAPAHFRLGQMYAIGRGQLRSVIEAHKHYNLASYLGDDRAVAALNVIEQTMTEDQLMSAERRARAYRELNGL